ncbi:Urb2/Npa2 family-domain-containing protein, partial [Lipomyces arxii]|uniref:Urb2/Npa2 family-domain-containing protein n=1 Tax=Lipomyces arxii TaxID=56418 RepID=UPI0034CFEA26
RTEFHKVVRGWSYSTYTDVFERLMRVVCSVTEKEDAKFIKTFTALVSARSDVEHAFLERKVALIVCALVLDQDKVESGDVFVALLELLDVIASKRAVVSPFVYEQMWLYLILSTSQSRGPFDAGLDLDSVYQKICGVCSTLVLNFPKYLRGRHNLVVSVLQNLMYGLCVVRPQSGKRADRVLPVEWKRPGWVSSVQSVGVKSALAYTRLLSNVCNPSPAVSSRKRGAGELSSASGASRRGLSKHAPFLVIEYCHATLNYDFASDVRKELGVGMYTVFDVLGATELRVVNAGVDDAGRAIFRNVYADYRRFGKW